MIGEQLVESCMNLIRCVYSSQLPPKSHRIRNLFLVHFPLSSFNSFKTNLLDESSSKSLHDSPCWSTNSHYNKLILSYRVISLS